MIKIGDIQLQHVDRPIYLELHHHVGATDLISVRLIDDAFSPIEVLEIVEQDDGLKRMSFKVDVVNILEKCRTYLYVSTNGKYECCFEVVDFLTRKTILVKHLCAPQTELVTTVSCNSVRYISRVNGHVLKPYNLNCVHSILAGVTASSIDGLYLPPLIVRKRTGDNKVVVYNNVCNVCDGNSEAFSVGQAVTFDDEYERYIITNIEYKRDYTRLTFDRHFTNGCKTFMTIEKSPLFMFDIINTCNDENPYLASHFNDCNCGEVYLSVPSDVCLIPTELGSNYRFDVFGIEKRNGNERRRKIITGELIVHPSVSIYCSDC